MQRTELIARGSIEAGKTGQAAVAHGMLIAAEHILCPLRLMPMIGLPKDDPVKGALWWHLHWGAIAAVGEVRARLLGYSVYGQIVRAYIQSQKPELLQLLDRLMAKDISTDEPIRICARVRDKHWAHWDYDVSERFVKGLKLDGSDPPVAVTAAAGKIQDTGIPWVREAWFVDLEATFGFKQDDLIQRTVAINDLVQATAHLARDAAIGLLLDAGVRFERVTRDAGAGAATPHATPSM